MRIAWYVTLLVLAFLVPGAGAFTTDCNEPALRRACEPSFPVLPPVGNEPPPLPGPTGIPSLPPGGPGIPGVPAIPGVPGISGLPTLPPGGGVPSIPSVPAVPGIPGISGLPDPTVPPVPPLPAPPFQSVCGAAPNQLPLGIGRLPFMDRFDDPREICRAFFE